MKTVLGTLLVLFFWIGLLAFWTSGFTTFTVFSKTLSEAGELPRNFPELTVTNQNNKTYTLQEMSGYKLLNFVYLSCPDVCHKVNNRLENIYHKIEQQSDFKDLNFLTMSFDLTRDNVERIKLYRSYFEADGNIGNWDFAVPYNLSQSEFDELLKELGIWKYTDPQTHITNHSLFLFLVSPDNRIVRIFDPARSTDDSITQEIVHCIKENTT